jgi:hypothetical protein
VSLSVRGATRDRSLRITWPDGTYVHAMFFPKGTGKSQVQIEHARLADRPAADAIRQFWGERLDALGEVLAQAPGVRR